jgi:hypothetical protein
VHPLVASGRTLLTAAGRLGGALVAGAVKAEAPSKARAIACETWFATAWAWACDMLLFDIPALLELLPQPSQMIDNTAATMVKPKDALLLIRNIEPPSMAEATQTEPAARL